MADEQALAQAGQTALTELPLTLEELSKDADLGGKMSMQDVSIPYVYVLQSNSPQVNPESEKYIEGAKPGMIYVTALEKVFEGKQEGLPFIPCYFEARINEWISRDAGGGLVNTYMPDDPIMNKAKPSDRGIPILPNGHLLVQTQYHYLLTWIPTEESWIQTVMPVKSTGLKNARKMNRDIATMKVPGTTTKAPRFLYKWTMKTMRQQKDQNIWSNFLFIQGDIVSKPQYEAAKNYALIAAKGILRKPQDEDQSTIEDEVPF